jgi:hypothetical protein
VTGRTVTLPVNPGASWVLAWGEAHDVHDDEIYYYDATDWLGLDTLTKADVYRTTDAAMTVYPAIVSGGVVSVRVVGGTANTTAGIGVILHYTSGIKAVEASMQITDLLAGLLRVITALTSDSTAMTSDNAFYTADAA